MSFQCQYPKICIYYQEAEKQNKSKRPICLLQDIEINYKNLTKIENCQDHKTYKENNDNWKIFLANPQLKK